MRSRHTFKGVDKLGQGRLRMEAIAWTLDASILSHHSRSGMVKSH